ncbi:MAG: hypothetical protein IPF57_25455 [Gammaproteobacteria bacterium]|nr:hypothetical protein [Gammaproteobacteria bacterium]
MKKLSSVETLEARLSVICADKTGTLTRAEMTIRRRCPDGAQRITGISYTPGGRVEQGAAALTSQARCTAEHVLGS